MQSVEAFPLCWPSGRPRTKSRTRARFHRRESVTRTSYDGKSSWQSTSSKSLTIYDSRRRVEKEIGMLGGKQTVISSNLELRNDGMPRSNQREPSDPGVAVYFMLNGQSRCVSCDKWDRAADNLAAIAKFVEAMRGQLRWGVGDVNAMFSGFKALPDATITPPPMSEEDAKQFIARGVSGCVPKDLDIRENFERAYREKAKMLHPDRNNGLTHHNWHILQVAAETIRRENGW